MLVSCVVDADVLPVSEGCVANLVTFLCEIFNVRTESVAVLFVKEDRISQLHQEFFHDPSVTDCITFPGESPKECLGEIYICPFIALLYSKEHEEEPYEELSRYLIHSFLHLLGYGDSHEESRKEMKEMEDFLLDKAKELSLLLCPS